MGQIGFDLGTEQEQEVDQKICPNWNVIILNDDHHTYEFVMMVMIYIFRKTVEEAFDLTVKVDKEGQAIAATCSKERAELYLEQVAGMKEGQLGAIGCVMEPAE
jgi:ATP-dependent Clp protease adaptor protein ClpS